MESLKVYKTGITAVQCENKLSTEKQEFFGHLMWCTISHFHNQFFPLATGSDYISEIPDFFREGWSDCNSESNWNLVRGSVMMSCFLN